MCNGPRGIQTALSIQQIIYNFLHFSRVIYMYANINPAQYVPLFIDLILSIGYESSFRFDRNAEKQMFENIFQRCFYSCYYFYARVMTLKYHMPYIQHAQEQFTANLHVSILWLGDAIGRHWSWSTLAQLTTCYPQQAIDWTNINFTLMRFCGIQLRAISLMTSSSGNIFRVTGLLCLWFKFNWNVFLTVRLTISRQ